MDGAVPGTISFSFRTKSPISWSIGGVYGNKLRRILYFTDNYSDGFKVTPTDQERFVEIYIGDPNLIENFKAEKVEADWLRPH